MLKMDIETLVANLQKVRTEYGDKAYEEARWNVAVNLVLKPNGRAFIQNAFPDLNIEELQKAAEKQAAEAASATPEEAMLGVLKAQIPNLRTQAHFNHFMACFSALRVTVNAYLGRDEAGATKARETLNQALDAVAQLPGMEDKLREMHPEAVSKIGAQEYLEPAKQLHEHDIQKELLTELGGIEDGASLQTWYDKNRTKIEGVVSKTLRDPLFDEIRRKRNAFAGHKAN